MSDKFKFAPGMPGFGTKGADGSTGSQGLAMYFTDLNPTSDVNTINSRIANSFDLWKNLSNPLPDGRNYVTGDLFFDSNGKAYEINAETYTFTSIGGNLNMGGFFVPLGISSDDGFQRYFNSNSSPKYIIDNIYTDSGAINYTESPASIYGITPENFARVEYSNVQKLGSDGNYLNPFTVYSSGVTALDDAKSMAIVRDISNNIFRIGNLDDMGKLRNLTLIFDVSSLQQTKQVGNTFNPNTPAGSILTNYEINANSLFDPNFNASPSSFLGIMGATDVSISWNLLDFTNDPTVTGDLYFFESLGSYAGNIFRIDSSAARPLIFTNIGAVGNVRITGISSVKAYGFYIKLSKNGWTRNSNTKYTYQGILNIYPSSFTLNSSNGDTTTCKFNVDANFTWNASIYQNPDNFMTITSCPSIGGQDGSINISITPNSSTNGRLGKIRVALQPGGSVYKDVSVWQPKGTIGPELSLYSSQIIGQSGSHYFLKNASQNGTVSGLATVLIDISSNRAWDTTGILPPNAIIVPDASGAGLTHATIIFNTNNTLDPIDGYFKFDYAGNSIYLDLYQEEVLLDIVAYGVDPYDDLQFYESTGAPVPPWNGMIGLKFTPSLPIDWQLLVINPTFELNPVSGTGDKGEGTYYYDGISVTSLVTSGTWYSYFDVSAGGKSRFSIYVDQQT
jgi:hypothetical protein